ncbi:MAG: response regulator [Pseudomonadota bacterium]
MEKETVVIVEDETKVAELLADYLRNEGYDVHCFINGDGLVNFIADNKPSLLLLDWMLPGMDGLNLCKRVRQLYELPIIMLTAKSEEEDRLLGFESGADDYICKPFSPREVVARVKALLKRAKAQIQDDWISLDPIKVGQHQNIVEIAGQTLDLTPTEFHILKVLVSNPNKVYSREQLFYKYHNESDENNARKIDSHIKNLRKKVSAAIPEHDIIKSVYGAGYKLMYPFS